MPAARTSTNQWQKGGRSTLETQPLFVPGRISNVADGNE